MKKITAKTRLNEVLKQNPDAAEILFKAGLSCIGCPLSMQETIEEGCKAHGMNKKEIAELIKRLNTKEKTK